MKFWVLVKVDLICQYQSLPKPIVILTKLFCNSGPNLMILAWTSDTLSRGQTRSWLTHRHRHRHRHTHAHTHRKTQAKIISKGRNWPRVKTTKTYSTFIHLESVAWRRTRIISCTCICFGRYIWHASVCPILGVLWWFNFNPSMEAHEQ